MKAKDRLPRGLEFEDLAGRGGGGGRVGRGGGSPIYDSRGTGENPRARIGGNNPPPMTIPDLLNSQFETTAKVLGISPAEVMKLWAKRRIPLAENEPQNVPGETATG